MNGLVWGPGFHGFWPLGLHGRVPEHEGLGILNTSPQASYVPMYILRPEKSYIHSFMIHNEMLTLASSLFVYKLKCAYVA